MSNECCIQLRIARNYAHFAAYPAQYDVTSQVQGHMGHHETKLEDFPSIQTHPLSRTERAWHKPKRQHLFTWREYLRQWLLLSLLPTAPFAAAQLCKPHTSMYGDSVHGCINMQGYKIRAIWSGRIIVGVYNETPWFYRYSQEVRNTDMV
jgi:hypothetical protein